MSDNLFDLYTKLSEALTLPANEVNEIATQLLDAPEDQFVNRNMRLQAILLHQNISRKIYDRLLNEFTPQALTAENSNVLHLLISSPNATLGDIFKLKEFAKQAGNDEWFDRITKKTLELSAYHLTLSYNGELMFQEEKVRENLTHTKNTLESFVTDQPHENMPSTAQEETPKTV